MTTIILFSSISCAVAGNNSSSRPFLDRFFLGFVTREGNVLVVIPSGENIEIGTKFFVVTPSTMPTIGEFTGVRDPTPDESEIAPASDLIAILKWNRPPGLAATPASNRIVLYSGSDFDPKRVGSVRKAAAKSPPGEAPTANWRVESRETVRLPSGERCSFEEDIAYDNPDKIGVIQAAFGKGSLSCPHGSVGEESSSAQSITERRWMHSILSVSDLNNDGKFEMVILTGSMYSGEYELRLFDGHEFVGDRKILHRWSD